MAASTRQIILYDLPSKPPCKSWSLNPWKTRLALNYKGLDYKTEWVEYPDIKPKFQKHFPPNQDGTDYTIPSIQFSDGSFMQDSRKIADKLEALYPKPSLNLSSPYQARIESVMTKLMPALFPEFVNKVPNRLLNEASLPHWYETRTKRFNGMPLEQAEKELGGEKAWEQTDPIVEEVTKMLKENPDGPFFEGQQVTYADFVWVGSLRFFERIGSGFLERALKTDTEGVHAKLYEASQKWLARDDH